MLNGGGKGNRIANKGLPHKADNKQATSQSHQKDDEILSGIIHVELVRERGRSSMASNPFWL